MDAIGFNFGAWEGGGGGRRRGFPSISSPVVRLAIDLGFAVGGWSRGPAIVCDLSGCRTGLEISRLSCGIGFDLDGGVFGWIVADFVLVTAAGVTAGLGCVVTGFSVVGATWGMAAAA